MCVPPLADAFDGVARPSIGARTLGGTGAAVKKTRAASDGMGSGWMTLDDDAGPVAVNECGWR